MIALYWVVDGLIPCVLSILVTFCADYAVDYAFAEAHSSPLTTVQSADTVLSWTGISFTERPGQRPGRTGISFTKRPMSVPGPAPLSFTNIARTCAQGTAPGMENEYTGPLVVVSGAG